MPNFDNLTIGFGYKKYIEKLRTVKEFTNLARYAQAMQNIIEKYSTPDPNQGNTIPAIDEEAKQLILSAYEQLSTEISNLKKESDTLLIKEDDRKLLDSLESSVSGDSHSIINYDPSKGYTNLPYIFETERAIKVDVSSYELGRAGGVQSSRIPFKYTAPDGRRYDGFFTESKNFEPEKKLRDEFDSIQDPGLKNFFKCCIDIAVDKFQEAIANPNPTEADKYYLKYTSKDIRDRIAKGEKISREELAASALSFYYRNMDYSKERITLNRKGLNNLYDDLKNSGKTEMINAADFLKNNQTNNDLYNSVCFIAENVNTFALNFAAGLESGNRIDSRNAAMSSVAALLGKPNIIAKAIPMTIIRDGKEIKGCFMSTANGFDPHHRTFNDINIRSDSLNKSPALASLADLQIIDFICGNTDRHNGNLCYQYDEKTRKMKSVIGIDNDQSFGSYVPKDDDDFIQALIPLNSMIAMTESMAQKLETLTKEQLMQTLKPYDIGSEQMEACWQRTQMVKNKIVQSREAYKDENKMNFHTNKLSIIPDKDFEKIDRMNLVSHYQEKRSANIFNHPKVLDNNLIDIEKKGRTDVSQVKHIFDANAVKDYAIDAKKTVDMMNEATTPNGGTSTEFENLKTAISQYALFHAKHTDAMMTDGDILQHDKMVSRITQLSDAYLQHHEKKFFKSGYANNRAELVREIKKNFAEKNISSKLTKEDRDLIHQEDEKNLNAMNSNLRSKAQMDLMKAVLLKDAQTLQDLAANGSQEAFETAVKNQVLHTLIANKFCDNNMQIKLNDFAAVQKLITDPGDNLQRVEETEHFRNLQADLATPEGRKAYADMISRQFKLKDNAVMEKSKDIKNAPDMELSM